jgi:aquaporin Z
MTAPADRWHFPWRIFLAEFVGTALLLLVGLSLVVVMFGAGGPGARLIPSERLRFVLTGFLFGATGGLIAISPLGRESGAHVNPVVTLAFWLARKLETRVALVYVAAQLTGAVVGSLPLLAWGGLGQSVLYGATVPGRGFPPGRWSAAKSPRLCPGAALRVHRVSPLRRFTPS